MSPLIDSRVHAVDALRRAAMHGTRVPRRSIGARCPCHASSWPEGIRRRRSQAPRHCDLGRGGPRHLWRSGPIIASGRTLSRRWATLRQPLSDHGRGCVSAKPWGVGRNGPRESAWMRAGPEPQSTSESLDQGWPGSASLRSGFAMSMDCCPSMWPLEKTDDAARVQWHRRPIPHRGHIAPTNSEEGPELKPSA